MDRTVQPAWPHKDTKVSTVSVPLMLGMEAVSRRRNHHLMLDLGGGRDGHGMHGVDDATGCHRPVGVGVAI